MAPTTGPEAGWTPRAGTGLVALSLLTALWALIAVWVGAPILDRPWSWWGLLPVLGTALSWWALSSFVRRRGRRPPFAYVLTSAAVVVVMAGSFFWGVTHSVVVDGRLYLESSSTARSYRLAQSLLADREYFAKVDELLALDPASARRRFDELEPAQRRMESIANHWDTVTTAELPDGDFTAVVAQARAAAHFGAQALERKQALLGVQDERVAVELETYRNTFVSNALKMGPDLAMIARRLGFSLGALPQPE